MPANSAIYLDSNAGALLHSRVIEAIQAVWQGSSSEIAPLLSNPSSIHAHGRMAKRSLANARESVATSLGAATDPEQIVFTSSGTEANQLGIRSALEAKLRQTGRAHWITTPVEHDSTLQMVAWLRERGGSVSFLPVDSAGRPQAGALASLWNSDTALVSAIWVNNETGVISEIEAIAAETQARGGLLHVDAAQAWGKLPIDAARLGADYLTLSAHKIGGLAGTGVLWLKSKAPLTAVLAGKQEKGRRGGTENLLGAIAAGAAASALAPRDLDEELRPLRDRLEAEILTRIPRTRINGEGAPRVANTLNLSFDEVEGDGMVMALDLAGFSVSSGSACSSGVLEPSHVLLALGRTPAQATSAIRISLSRGQNWETLMRFVMALEQVVNRVRKARSSLTA